MKTDDFCVKLGPGIRSSKAGEFEFTSTFFLRCAQLFSIDEEQGFKKTKLLLMLGADALLAHAKRAWQSGAEGEGVVSSIERALSCVQRCRSLMARAPPGSLLLTAPATSMDVVSEGVESSIIVNSSATTEDKGLPHLATMECRLRCLLIDVTQKEDEDSLKSILHAAEQLETANARTFLNIYDALSTSALKHPALACHTIKLAVRFSIDICLYGLTLD